MNRTIKAATNTDVPATADQRMIPAGVIDRIDAQDRTVSVKLTKDDIKHAPDLVEESADQRALDRHRDDVLAYYSRWWG